MSTKVAIATETVLCIVVRFKGNSDMLISELRTYLVVGDFHEEWGLSFLEHQNILHIFSLSKNMTIFNKIRMWLENKGCDILISHSLES